MPAIRSIIWNHFKKTTTNHAQCKHCCNTISYTGGSIGNLNRHMRLKHPFVHLNSIVEDVNDISKSMEVVDQVEGSIQHERQSDAFTQKSLQSRAAERCDPYENVVLYDEKTHHEAADYSQLTMHKLQENSKNEPEEDDPDSAVEYPFDLNESYDAIQPRSWTPVNIKQSSRGKKQKKTNLAETCEKLVKTLEAREARDERLSAQQQSVIAKLDQTLLLMTQVLVKLNDKFDKL